MCDFSCAICVELRMSDENYRWQEAITMIDGIVMCFEHAKLYIKARAEKKEKERKEMDALASSIQDLHDTGEGQRR